MKNFAGAPGTIGSLVLRIFQFSFAAMSLTAMVTTSTFFSVTVFCYLIAAMGLQGLWGFGLAILDACSLLQRKCIYNPTMLSFFVVGDLVSSILSLAAASSSAAVTVLIFHDLGHCTSVGECHKYQLSVGFAYISWVSIEASAFIMLWVVATS